MDCYRERLKAAMISLSVNFGGGLFFTFPNWSIVDDGDRKYFLSDDLDNPNKYSIWRLSLKWWDDASEDFDGV